MEPRPLRHLHFLTETAIHSEDDAKKTIFIDSVGNNEKSPGSSLFETHEDVLAAKKRFKDTYKYSVETISLATLMKQTLSFYQEEKSEDKVVKANSNSTSTKKDSDFDASAKTMEALSRQHLVCPKKKHTQIRIEKSFLQHILSFDV